MKLVQLPSGDLIVKKRGKVYILVENLSLMELPFVTKEQAMKIQEQLDDKK